MKRINLFEKSSVLSISTYLMQVATVVLLLTCYGYLAIIDTYIIVVDDPAALLDVLEMASDQHI